MAPGHLHVTKCWITQTHCVPYKQNSQTTIYSKSMRMWGFSGWFYQLLYICKARFTYGLQPRGPKTRGAPPII